MDDYGTYEYIDPYDAMPFGDAMRFEDEQVARDIDAGEGQPDDADQSFDASDFIVATMFYLDHERGVAAHTGVNYVNGCPTCDSTYFTSAELEIIDAIAEFVTDKVTQLRGTVQS